jgi:hypothetical protein
MNRLFCFQLHLYAPMMLYMYDALDERKLLRKKKKKEGFEKVQPEGGIALLRNCEFEVVPHPLRWGVCYLLGEIVSKLDNEITGESST